MNEKAKPSAVEQIKKLQEQQAKLMEEAKTDLLATAQKAVEDLNALGFLYRLVDGTEKKTATRKASTGTRQVKNEPCPVCKVLTSPAHDLRSHRQQGQQKKPFTDAEMKARGLVRVE